MIIVPDQQGDQVTEAQMTGIIQGKAWLGIHHVCHGEEQTANQSNFKPKYTHQILTMLKS